MNKGIVFKYPINIGGSTVVEVSAGSQILSAKAQGDTVVAYVLENQEQRNSDGIETLNFYSVGTGHGFTVTDEMEYIDTVMLYDGKFVLHIFKR